MISRIWFRLQLFTLFFLVMGYHSAWHESQLFAGIPEKFGVSAWQSSMSGAGNARINDPSAAYFNPAGLAMPGAASIVTKKHEMLTDLGFQSPALKINTMNGSALSKQNAALGSAVRSYPLMNAGFNFDLRPFVDIYKDIPVRIGILAALPGIAGTEIASLTEESAKFYSFHGMGRQAVKPNIAAAIGIQPWKNYLSFGVGMLVTAGASGTMYMHKIYTDNRPPVSELFLDVSMRPSLTSGIQFTLPLKNMQRLSAGLSYRQENYVPARIDIDVLLPEIANFSLRHRTAIELITFYEPHTVTFGAGYSWRSYAFYLDGEYQAWSQFSRGKTRFLLEGLPEFKDTFGIKTGFDLGLPWYDIKARTGYSFIAAFTKDQVGVTNYLDNNKHIFSFGVGKFIQKLPAILAPDSLSLDLELSFQWQYWQPRKSIKNVLDPISDGSFQPDYIYGGNLYLFHFTVRAYI